MNDFTDATEEYGLPIRKYEVFLSSTYIDLIELRKAFLEETHTLGHIGSGMELFARGSKDTDYITERIAKADVFVILVGARLGSRVRLHPNHFIQFEYDIAVKLNKPILAYLLDDTEYDDARNKIPRDDPEYKYNDELDAFRSGVKQFADGTGRLTGSFSLKSNPKEILHLYAQDLLAITNDLKSQNKGGWIRSEVYDSITTVSNNRFFKRFVKELNKFDVLSARIVQNGPELKVSIAQFFLERYLARMVEKEIKRLFFESGSSIAFLSERFIEWLHREPWLKDYSPKLNVHTNNILTYIDFTLTEAIHVELFPDGPPEKKYGATFGRLTTLPKLQPPGGLRDLHASANEIVSQMTAKLVSLYQDDGVILMTASGLEVSDQSLFHGPHVGSYFNMLFKKALLGTGCPTVIFMDETKLLDNPFDPAVCYPVCDKGLSWSVICRENPIAIAIGCTSEVKGEESAKLLAMMGLDIIEKRSEVNGGCSVIASNKIFAKRW